MTLVTDVQELENLGVDSKSGFGNFPVLNALIDKVGLGFRVDIPVGFAEGSLGFVQALPELVEPYGINRVIVYINEDCFSDGSPHSVGRIIGHELAHVLDLFDSSKQDSMKNYIKLNKGINLIQELVTYALATYLLANTEFDIATVGFSIILSAVFFTVSELLQVAALSESASEKEADLRAAEISEAFRYGEV